MDNKGLYEGLRDKLAVTPMGVPEGDDFLEILSILFTEEEAKMALILPFMPAPIDDIVKGAGIKRDETEKILSDLADKGLVYAFEYKGTPMFMLFSVLPGIFEFPIMKKTLDIDYPRLKELWRGYHEDGWGDDGGVAGAAIPFGRTLVIEEDIDAGKDVLPTDLVYKYIDEAKYISVGDCSCRQVVGACDAPHDVCMGLGYGAKFLAERGIARLIDKDEAYAVVKKAHENGLVSVASNTKDEVEFICHCCSCCCGMLSIATIHGRYDMRPKGSFIACIDGDECTACGSCEEICPMEAISIDDIAEVDEERCIGCGLCISTCPSEVISLVRRVGLPDTPKNIVEWSKEVVEARGTAEAYMKELTVRTGEDKE